MNTAKLVVNIALLVIAIFDMAYVYARQLMMLQQNSYRTSRYWRWYKSSGESTNIGFLCSIVAFGLLLTSRLPFIGAILAALILLGQGVSLMRAKYKKPLVMTARATRIYATMWALAVVAVVPASLMYYGHIQLTDADALNQGLALAAKITVGTVVAGPFVLLLAHWIQLPNQRRINRRFYREAQDILNSMPNLKIIGITGSYGKTSTKHYLNRILQEKYDVVMTPGSFNTPMGVIRTVREYMKPYNEVFICEMGAKQLGDIKEICDLVHPSMGIVTAVGEQHLESFKSIDNVQRTKFELVDALPADGLAVVNDDFEMAANRGVDNVKCLRYAVKNTQGAQIVAKDVKYTPRGTDFTIVTPDRELQLSTRLVGECNVSNLMGAVAIAMALDVPDEKIRYAVEQIEQVEHRLNMKRTAGGLTIIDDAFNSNPTGSRMALDVLGAMTGGRRFVITPGMIELGDKQVEYNRDFGRHIAKNADVALIVGHYNREAILDGLREGGMPSENVYAVDTFAEAQAKMTSMAQRGDTVLYENDLPDTFK